MSQLLLPTCNKIPHSLAAKQPNGAPKYKCYRRVFLSNSSCLDVQGFYSAKNKKIKDFSACVCAWEREIERGLHQPMIITWSLMFEKPEQES